MLRAKLQNFKDKKGISMKDISELFHQTQTIQSVHNEIKGFISQLNQINQQFQNKPGNDHDILIDSLNKLVKNYGNEFNKEINLVTSKYKNGVIPNDKTLFIKDICRPYEAYRQARFSITV